MRNIDDTWETSGVVECIDYLYNPVYATYPNNPKYCNETELEIQSLREKYQPSRVHNIAAARKHKNQSKWLNFIDKALKHNKTGWLDHYGYTDIDGKRYFVSEPYPGNINDMVLEANILPLNSGFLRHFKLYQNSWWWPGQTLRFITEY